MSKLTRRRSLGSWIKRVASGSSNGSSKNKGGVFGVPLVESIRYAWVTMSYTDETAVKHTQAGVIPLVVAKCGAFLKSQALSTEYVFLLPGDSRHVDELQFIFDDKQQAYGAHVLWDPSYTVHDVAALLLRYFDDLPDSVVPKEATEAFIGLLVVGDTHDEKAIIHAFQDLVRKTLVLPHQHLLLYLIDLLSLVACHARHSHMDATKLADIFGPRLLRHAKDRKQTQTIVRFLIESQALSMMQKAPPPPSAAASRVLLVAPRPIRPIPISVITMEASGHLARILHPKKHMSAPTNLLLQRDQSNEEHHPPSRKMVVVTQQQQQHQKKCDRVATTANLRKFPTEPAAASRGGGVQFDFRIQWLLDRFKGKPAAYICWIAVMALVVGVLFYETYQVLWGKCCFEPIVFFVGFGFYWVLLVKGIAWSHPKSRHKKSSNQRLSLRPSKNQKTSSKRIPDQVDDDTMSITSIQSRFAEELVSSDEEENSSSSKSEPIPPCGQRTLRRSKSTSVSASGTRRSFKPREEWKIRYYPQPQRL